MLCGGFELCCIFMGRFEFVGVGNVDDFVGFLFGSKCRSLICLRWMILILLFKM